MESLPDFQINFPKANMLNKQNSFSNKNNSFISQIISDLATPVTSDNDPRYL